MTTPSNRLCFDPREDNVSGFIACFVTEIKSNLNAARRTEGLSAPIVLDADFHALSAPAKKAHAIDDATIMRILRNLLKQEAIYHIAPFCTLDTNVAITSPQVPPRTNAPDHWPSQLRQGSI
jgi:hypothetical protein